MYILSGRTELAGGRTWAVRDNFSLDGLGNDEFEDKTTALMKCLDTTNCKGVVKKNNGKFVIATKKSLKPKKHFITYTMGRYGTLNDTSVILHNLLLTRTQISDQNEKSITIRLLTKSTITETTTNLTRNKTLDITHITAL